MVTLGRADIMSAGRDAGAVNLGGAGNTTDWGAAVAISGGVCDIAGGVVEIGVRRPESGCRDVNVRFGRPRLSWSVILLAGLSNDAWPIGRL